MFPASPCSARPAAPLVLAIVALVLTACGGAGPYGHAPAYVELSEEAAAAAGAREFDPVMAERRPEEWSQGSVVLFGVVESRTAGPGGQALLRLSLRRLEPRNLCDNRNDDDSCRVTVSDKDFGVVWVLASLRAGDDVGSHPVGARSLLRVVGRIGQEPSPGGPGPVIHASYYRHWPNFFYVTKKSARDLRQ
jgi:hypothetical protein